MNKVLASIEPVVKQSKHVSINHVRLTKICQEWQRQDLPIKQRHWLETSPFSFRELRFRDQLNFLGVWHSINFCYWSVPGKPKWTIKHQGLDYDGAWAMMACLDKALNQGRNIIRGEYLANLDRKTLADILKGNTEIPLLDERLKILNEVGSSLSVNFRGQFYYFVTSYSLGRDILRILNAILINFPSFDDQVNYNGQPVYFYKRAQLLIHDWHHLVTSRNHSGWSNIEQLTAFADYKLPQFCRHLGILVYSDKLAQKVDNYEIIEAGSPEEIEIRANLVWAIYLMSQQLNLPQAAIDSMMWLASQGKPKDIKPYHRTLTTAY